MVQVWLPGGPDITTDQAILRSVTASFPYVRCFISINGWGLHILSSMDPIQNPGAPQLAARLPASAKKDLLEWSTSHDAVQDIAKVLSHEYLFQFILNSDPEVQITDDNPLNEYFLFRRHVNL